MAGQLPDGLQLRTITDGEYAVWSQAIGRQFGGELSDEALDAYRRLTDLDQSYGVFDGEQIVGTTAAHQFSMTIPSGGQLRCAGITGVGVRTSHRRQGLLATMMHRQLADLAAGGVPLAALLASESGIYGRFGYGPAIPTVSLSIDRHAAQFSSGRPPRERIDMLTGDAAVQRIPDVYAPIQRSTTGMLARPQAWWPFWLGRDPESARDGFGPRFCAVLADRGYVVYRIKRGSNDDVPHGLLRVSELVAADVEAYRALWQFVFDVDLVGVIEAKLRPADELLSMLLAEPLRLRQRKAEPFYLRLTQLDVSLAARRYASQDSLVLQVHDAVCDWNAGYWRLEASESSASCTRTDDEPDLTLDTRELATAYLGAVSFRRLALAGLVAEHTPGAVSRADALFVTDAMPWTPFDF